jgi:DNA-binding protein HU-beta
MRNVTRQSLISEVCDSTGMHQSAVRPIVESFFACIQEQLAKGNSIEIRGFGTFSPCKRRSRIARNLSTGESLPLPESYSANLKFTPRMFELLNEFWAQLQTPKIKEPTHKD